MVREALEKLIEIEKFIARDSPRRAEKFINYLVEQGKTTDDTDFADKKSVSSVKSAVMLQF
ncbi:MAG: hypothetical protein GF353_09805 [Candidatus Lokiarchaeota archaeon]|nr:hypothetical protein [Candidatus Lokiarchaeota archaeon]